MSETSELHQKVDKILQKVESIDNFQLWIVKPHADTIKKSLMIILNKRERMAKVYLAINGIRTVTEIVKLTGISQSHVSDEIKNLVEMGLVESNLLDKKLIYQKNKIDKVLGLSKELEKKFIPTNGKNTLVSTNNLVETNVIVDELDDMGEENVPKD